MLNCCLLVQRDVEHSCSRVKIDLSKRRIEVLKKIFADLPNTFTRNGGIRYLHLVKVGLTLSGSGTDIRKMLDAIVPRDYDYVYCRVRPYRSELFSAAEDGVLVIA